MNSLFTRLSLIFFLILLMLGMATLWLSQRSSQNYFLEFTQKLNWPIAMYIAENARLFEDGVPDPKALERLAPHVMMINPGLEVYLLDPDGRILSSVMGSANARSHIAMEPIRKFVADPQSLPIQGDDPKYKDRRSVFSAHPLYEENTISSATVEQSTGTDTNTKSLLGYIYVVLASEKKETLFKSVQNSYSLGELFMTLLGVLALALISGLLLFFMLTRRLRSLTARVKTQHYEFAANSDLIGLGIEKQGSGDEIELLSRAHDALTEQLVQQNSKLKATDVSHRQFVASMSHDLRTPLMTLQNYLETLQAKDSILSASSKQEFVFQAGKQCSRLGHLINQLFELSKLNSPDILLQPERFSVLELVYDCLQDFRLMCQDRNLNLNVVVDDDESGYEIVADIAAIHRLLENLIGNAVKYTNARGNILIELSRPNDLEVEITVQNSGVIFSEKQMQSFFDKYSKYYYTKDMGDSGSLKTGGLGLLIVKTIIDLHKGNIRVESGAGYGVRFRVSLPASASPECRHLQTLALSA